MRQAAKPRKENTTFIYVYNNPQSMLYYNTMKPTLQINFFLAIPFLLCVTGIWPVHCSAQGTDNQNTYSDVNGYFSFTPPPGWKKEELSVEYRSHVMFQNQEETAKIMVFAEMDYCFRYRYAIVKPVVGRIFDDTAGQRSFKIYFPDSIIQHGVFHACVS